MATDSEIDYKSLKIRLKQVASEDELLTLIVNAPFQTQEVAMAMLFLGFICLYIVDENEDNVALAGASDTEYYRLALKDYPLDMSQFRLSLKNINNDIVRAIANGEVVHNADWTNLRRPDAQVEAVRVNQANSGIAVSYIYPLSGQRRGAIMYNFFQYSDAIGQAQLDFMKRYTKLVSTYLSPNLAA